MKFLKVLLAILIVLLLYVAYTMQSSGFFRVIENRFDGELLTKVEVPGAEDMQADYEDGFLIVSSDDRAARRDGNARQGHLYKLDLKEPQAPPVRLTGSYKRPLYPHGISMLRLSDSSHRLMVVNHAQRTHTIEVFDLFGDSLVHRETKRDPLMISPNDVVAIDSSRFYFTNDHGYASGFKRMAEEYLGLRASNVVYYDGANYQVVAEGIAYANGINRDKARDLLYVASPRGFLVKVYNIKLSGDLEFVENIDCGTGVDNIELDQEGRLWIGSHPSLLHYSMYAGAKRAQSGSEIITIDYQGTESYQVESVYLNDGTDMSAATVAVPYQDLILAGNVMDEAFIILKRP